LITLDSDGQHDINDIPKLINPILIGKADISIGSRYLEEDSIKKIPKYRSFGIKTITKFVQASSYKELTDSQSGYRAYNKYALSKLDLYEDGMALSTEVLLRAKENNLQIKEVPIKVSYDKDSSTHSPIMHGLSVLTSVVQFISLKHPLSFYGLAGIFLLLVGIYFMNDALTLFSETRYVSTPLIVLSMGTAVVGIVLFATGVILYTLTALLRGKIKNS